MSSETSISYRVPYADTDQMGVVYYANYLVYFERCRSELLINAGMSYKQMEKDGFALPVIEAVCRYKSSARYEDMLTITGKVTEAKGVRLRIDCEVRRGDELLASGYTIHACVNSSGKPVRIPQGIAALAVV